MTIRIEEVGSVDDQLVGSLNALLPLLSSSAPPLTSSVVSEIVDNPNTHLLIALDDDERIVGTLTLALFRSPGGPKAWIEDVIVSEAARGHGVGESLTRRAIEIAEECGARDVDLTSRPSREAANRLYVRVGFALRETNVYRYSLDD